MPVSRRTFVRGLATGAVATPLLSGRILGANDTLRVAVIGIRGQGQTHIAQLQQIAGVEVVALCDADADVLGGRAKAFAAKYGREVDTAKDLRTILDRKDVDAISTATPNHWHALVGVWACQAGKDAYVEKPISHNAWEGRQLVNAARKYDRIVQGGTQSRSMASIRAAVAFVHEGKLGALQRVNAYCYKPRTAIGNVGKGKVPTSVDYDLWCGPAPLTPLARRDLHYDWHWQWATGNGDLGNQGIHQMDVARWILGESGLPRQVLSIGGRLGYEDDGETPNTQVTLFDYAKAPLVFEVRGLPRGRDANNDGKWGAKEMDPVAGLGSSGAIGVVAHCAQGYVAIDTGGARAYEPDGTLIKKFEGGGNPYENFIDAVRSHDRSKLNAEVEETHLSSALCHYGLISHLRGHAASVESIERFVGDDALGQAFAGMRAHLERNGVDLGHTPLTLGQMLHLDPETEHCVGDYAADALRTRVYRAPFVVPTIA